MQDFPKNIFGITDRLREVIAKTGLSQAKFAKLIDEDLFRLKNVLSGQVRPPADMIQKILARCDVDGLWFMTGSTLEVGELSYANKVMQANFDLLSPTEQDVFRRAIAALANAQSKPKEKAKI
jgi:transcriptional regulator with XRE-family HTH domain